MPVGLSSFTSTGVRPMPAEARLLAERLFQRSRSAHWSRADRRFALLMILQSALGAAFIGWQSVAGAGPRSAAAGALAAALAAGLCGVVPAWLARHRAGRTGTRHTVAVLQAAAAAAWVHICPESSASHFLLFASFAALTCYQDSRVLASAFAVVAGYCLLRTGGWMEAGAAEPAGWLWIERLAWIVPEVLFLAYYSRTSVHDLRAAVERHAALEYANAAFERALHQRTAELRAGEARTRSILETAADAIITFSKTGEITSWNRTAEVMFGAFGPKALQARSLFQSPYDGVFSEMLTQILSGDGADHLGSWREMRARRKGGEVFDVELSISEARTENSLFFTGAIHDISNRKVIERLSYQYAEELNQARIVNELNGTRLRQAVSDLEAARIRAEDANRSKSEFLASVSHEIRTPMNGILGMADLALEGELDGEQRDYLETIRSSGESLLEIINELLDFSKIEAGKVELCEAPFSLRGTIAAMLSPLAVRAHQKGLELIYRVAPDVPDALFADDLRLRQILINLIGNAIKFTARGEVAIECRREAAESADGCALLRFSVRDTGIGISPEGRQRLFHAFCQADPSTARKYGGTGLGLSISAKLARMLGGELSVESVEGAGSTFSFRVMLNCLPEDEAGIPAEFASLQSVPVLIVDDSRPAAAALTETLAAWGFQAKSCASADEALAILAALPPHERRLQLVLIDSHLPKGGARQIIETLGRASIPVRGQILLQPVGLRLTDHPASLANIPALDKPVSHDALRQALGEALGVAAENRPPERAPALPGVVTGSLRILLVEDNPVNRKLATRILQSRRHHVETAENGNEAVAAVFANDFDLVLMDVQMPEKDGLDATREIRAREETLGRHVPIIAMTAHALRGDRETCLAAGMDDYLTKPIRPDDVFGAIERIMTRFQRRERPAAAADVPGVDDARAAPSRSADPRAQLAAPDRPGDEPSFAVIDLAVLRDRTCGDPEFLREMAELFLQESPAMLDDVRQAVEAGDPRRINRTAHALKGSIGTYSLAGVYDAALRLEQAGGDGETGSPELLANLASEYERLCAELRLLLSDPDISGSSAGTPATEHTENELSEREMTAIGSES